MLHACELPAMAFGLFICYLLPLFACACISMHAYSRAICMLHLGVRYVHERLC